MLNHMVMEYWTYGEHGEGFGMLSNAFFTAEPTDNIQRLNHAGRSDKVKWGRSDLKLGKFQFLDFLDCRNISEAADLQFSLSERVFVHNNLLSPGTGYTPQQLVLGISSGIPGIFQIPNNPGSLFARSLKRITEGIHHAQADCPCAPGKQGVPKTLGDDFPYEPGDFIGPCDRIGQGHILSNSGKNYHVAHSGMRISSLSKDYISPTLRTRKIFCIKGCPLFCTKYNKM